MLELWAAGFNAHGQLDGREGVPDDVFAFTQVAEGEDLEVLSASWCSTLLRQEQSLTFLGHFSKTHQGTKRRYSVQPVNKDPVLRCFRGDTPADVGAISPNGRIAMLSLVSEEAYPADVLMLSTLSSDDSPRVAYVSVTATGRTCVAILQASAEDVIHIIEFESFNRFERWYRDPVVVADEHATACAPRKFSRHFMIRGRVAQLDTGAAYFVLRTQSGEVYTWTPDARQHRCLARETSKQCPADEPGLVDALAGIPIAKVAVGGWMTVALSRDGDAYAWGQKKPQEGSEDLSVLPGPDEDVRLIDVADSADIKDVAVGSGHVLLLTKDGRLFGAGSNHNGQLSLPGGATREHVEDLIEVEMQGQDIQRVWCGACTSFLLIRK